MSIPCELDEPSVLDEFEVLLDDCRADFLFLEPQYHECGDVCPPTTEEEYRKNKKVKSKPKKSRSAKNVIKVPNTDMVVTKKVTPCVPARLKWYVFPSFDRSDSTIYFASSFARMTNSGDEEGLNKLITTHCAKDTIVVLREKGMDGSGGFSVPLAMYMDLLSMISIIHPDCVCCMHSTRVEGNTIRAVLYNKVTDLAEINDHRASIVDPKFAPFFSGKRKDLFVRNLSLNALEPSKRTAIFNLLDLNVDLQIYSKIDIVLRLHDVTKKIVEFTYNVQSTSLFYDGVHYPTL